MHIMARKSMSSQRNSWGWAIRHLAPMGWFRYWYPQNFWECSIFWTLTVIHCTPVAYLWPLTKTKVKEMDIYECRYHSYPTSQHTGLQFLSISASDWEHHSISWGDNLHVQFKQSQNSIYVLTLVYAHFKKQLIKASFRGYGLDANQLFLYSAE